MLTSEMSYTRASRADGHEKIDKATRQKMILECLERGEMTAREIAYCLGFSERNAVAPRLTELKAAGLVEPSGRKMDTTTGVKVTTWALIKERQQ